MLHVLWGIFYSRSLSSVCSRFKGGGSTLPGDPHSPNMKFFIVDYNKNSVCASDIPNRCSRKSRYTNKWRMRVGRLFGREGTRPLCWSRRQWPPLCGDGLHIYMCEIDISWPVAVRHESPWRPWRPYSPSGLLQTGLGRALLLRLIIDTLHLSTVVLGYKMNRCLS